MTYYFPNRPLLIPPDQLPKYEAANWVAEVKKNGDRLELLTESGRIGFWNRYKKLLKYEPTDEVMEDLVALRIPSNSQVDAELIHNHTKSVKNLVYVYDVYQWKGEEIEDQFDSRRARLEDLFSGRSLSGHVILASQYRTGFLKLFQRVIPGDENEGLVLKNRRGKIQFNPGHSLDVWWQLKARRPHKNYQF